MTNSNVEMDPTQLPDERARAESMPNRADALSMTPSGPAFGFLSSWTLSLGPGIPSCIAQVIFVSVRTCRSSAGFDASLSKCAFRLGIVLIVLLIGILGTGLNVALADDGQELAETFITRLDPGDNLIGWTEHAEPVESLFDAVPQIQHVWGWDSSRRQWRFAAPALPSQLWTLHTLNPGMGLLVRIHSDGPVEWVRSRRPAQGTVELNAGWNLVAWLGPDDALMNWAARGIGRSLTHAGLWSPTTQSAHIHSMDDLESPTNALSLAHGHALWVKVDRSVKWLQPTGVLPSIVFYGDPSPQTRENFRLAIKSTIKSFAETFAIEADPAILQITAFGTYQQYLNQLGSESPKYSNREFSGTGGWANYADLFIHESRFAVSPDWGIGLLMHEYIHVLQRQLPLANSDSPSWLYEGQAEWVPTFIELGDDREYWDRTAASYADSGIHLTDSPYSLGFVAAEMLARDHGPNALLDFWKAIGSSDPNGITIVTWQDVFRQSFGIDADAFQQQFAEWQNQITGGLATVTILLQDSIGLPITNWHVHITNQDHKPTIIQSRVGDVTQQTWSGGGHRLLVTNEHGGIELTIAKHHRYEIAYGPFGTNHPCYFYYDETPEKRQATLLRLGDREQANIIQVLNIERLTNGGTCGYALAGRVADSDGNPMVGTVVWAEGEGTKRASKTDAQGHFLIPVSTPGRYHVSHIVNECRWYYHPRGGSLKVEQAAPLQVQRRNLKGLELSAPDVDCNVVAVRDGYTLVGGTVRSEAGDPVRDVDVYVSSEAIARHVMTDASGAFEMQVPNTDTVQIYLDFDGCDLYYREEGPMTTNSADASRLSLSSADTDGLMLQIPAGLCSRHISGRLLDAGGDPLADVWIHAQHEGGSSASVLTNKDGTFVIRISETGNYRVEAQINEAVSLDSTGGTRRSGRGDVRLLAASTSCEGRH